MAVSRATPLNSSKVGLELKTTETEELVETVDVTEEVDEDQQMEDEVINSLGRIMFTRSISLNHHSLNA
jgi:hypothetical protein